MCINPEFFFPYFLHPFKQHISNIFDSIMVLLKIFSYLAKVMIELPKLVQCIR